MKLFTNAIWPRWLSLPLISLVLLFFDDAVGQQPMRTWASDDALISFAHPSSWLVRTLPTEDSTARAYFAGTGHAECQIWVLTVPSSASLDYESMRAVYGRAIAPERWLRMVEPHEYFEGGSTFLAQSVEDRHHPLQHAILEGGGRRVLASLQGRSGLEVLSLCVSFDGQDRSETFAMIERSITLRGD